MVALTGADSFINRTGCGCVKRDSIIIKQFYKFLYSVLFQAYQVYQKAADRGFFKSVYQRSLYNVESLKSQPWWTAKQAGYTDDAKVCCYFENRIFCFVQLSLCLKKQAIAMIKQQTLQPQYVWLFEMVTSSPGFNIGVHKYR